MVIPLLVSDLIPSEGRTIQCGSCNHVWFYKKDQENQLKSTKIVSKNYNETYNQNIQEKEKPTIEIGLLFWPED